MSGYTVTGYTQTIEQIAKALGHEGEVRRRENSDDYLVPAEMLHSVLFWAQLRRAEHRHKVMKGFRKMRRIYRILCREQGESGNF